jgi:peptidoglycan/xylan/chitin deacetylase (PgdA/CDA1 family)
MTRATKKGLFISLGTVVAVASIVLGYLYVPIIFHLPIDITYNGVAYGARSATLAQDFIDAHGGLENARGDVKADTGLMIAAGEGEPASATVNGKPLTASTKIYRHTEIVVTPGKDIVHKTEWRKKSHKPKYQKRGSGPLTGVVSKGATGESEDLIDTVTDKVLEHRELKESKTVKTRSVRGSKLRPKLVALTFDDGPNAEYTPQVLKVLKKYKVKATFFQVGNEIEEHPELTRRLRKAGMQVGLHSYSHKDLAKLSAKGVRSELRKSQEAYKEATGKTASWMRLPYGSGDNTTYSLVAQQGLGNAMWSVDPRDWSRPGTKTIRNRVLRDVRPGSVILMHDGGGPRSQTVAALPKIIKTLKKRGYNFVTVDQLYKAATK